MKILAVFAIILMACLLLGCGEEEEDQEDQLAGVYEGFPVMKGGEWAEHITHTEAGETKIRFEYIGTDTIDGSECLVIELNMEPTAVSQVWIDKDSAETVLCVMKVSGIVMKIDFSELPASSADMVETASGETPDEYEPGTETSAETYETPTGKKVQAAVFKTGSEEEWVSGEVPFGIVKVVQDGEPVMELYDFSFSGAVRDISKEEAESAGTLPSIPDFPGLP